MEGGVSLSLSLSPSSLSVSLSRFSAVANPPDCERLPGRWGAMGRRCGANGGGSDDGVELREGAVSNNKNTPVVGFFFVFAWNGRGGGARKSTERKILARAVHATLSGGKHWREVRERRRRKSQRRCGRRRSRLSPAPLSPSLALSSPAAAAGTSAATTPIVQKRGTSHVSRQRGISLQESACVGRSTHTHTRRERGRERQRSDKKKHEISRSSPRRPRPPAPP